METIICLIRHGETAWNRQLKIQGRIDNPLNEVGKNQIFKTAKYLQKMDPSWDVILSSPLQRAKESATIIAQVLCYSDEIIIDPMVMERDFGEAEGAPICKEVYDRIAQNDFPHMETAAALQERSYRALLEIVHRYPGKKILVATHSHFIKGFFTNISQEFTFTSTLVNGAICYITWDDMKVKSYLFNVLPDEKDV